MPLKKIIYIISNIDKSLLFEWTVKHLAQSKKIKVSYILLNPGESSFAKLIRDNGLPLYEIIYSGKKSFFKALFEVYNILRKQKPDAINTHLFDASLIGIIAGWAACVKTRILSRHHSTLHHVYHPHAVRYDKIMNRLATKIIVASKMVRDILVEKEKVRPSKIEIINHGFMMDDFRNVDSSRIDLLRQKYVLVKNQNAFPVIGVISRHIHWKGIQYIIPAFKNLLNDYPNAHLILANAKGDYKNEIRKLLLDIPACCFTEIEYEYDSPALYKLFDVFVHVPINYHSEAFGQIYIEALAARIPCVFTISGIAGDFIEDKKNALVVPYKDPVKIYEAIKTILTDENLKRTIVENGEKDVLKSFHFNVMAEQLDRLYLQL